MELLDGNMKKNCYGSYYKLYLIIVSNIKYICFFYIVIYLVRKVKEYILILVVLKYWIGFYYMIFNGNKGGRVRIFIRTRNVFYILLFLKLKGNFID